MSINTPVHEAYDSETKLFFICNEFTDLKEFTYKLKDLILINVSLHLMMFKVFHQNLNPFFFAFELLFAYIVLKEHISKTIKYLDKTLKFLF